MALVADVQILATSLTSGSGGREVLLRFLRFRALEDLDDEIRFNTLLNATSVDARRALSQVIALGLARDVVRTHDGASFALQYRRPSVAAQARSTRDPWSYWICSIGASGYGSGQSRSNSSTVTGPATAQRTTEHLKFESRALADLNRSSYQLSASTRCLAEVRDYERSGVPGVLPGQHVSLGTSANLYSYTVDNFDLAVNVSPTVEFDFFPHHDFTRRRLMLSYSVGWNRFEYEEPTVYDMLADVRVDQVLWPGLATRQPWGNMDIGVTASSYLPDVELNETNVSSDFTFRITRGLRVRARASDSRVRDQINLPREEATDEEVPFELRSLRTDNELLAQFGREYTFGSTCNSVVNPRMSSNCR